MCAFVFAYAESGFSYDAAQLSHYDLTRLFNKFATCTAVKMTIRCFLFFYLFLLKL